jgi:hypothetical protein
MKNLASLIEELEIAIADAKLTMASTEEELIDLFSDDLEEAAKWTRAYINSLPDSAFIYIEPGYKEGQDKRARHLPYKDDGGKIDLPHLRNALARCNQIKPVLGKVEASTMRNAACKKANSLAKKHLKSRKTRK